MFEIDVEQGTAEWLQLRVGKVTGTRLKEVLKKDNLPLVDEMIAEIGVGSAETSFVTSAMQRGNDMEKVALKYYTDCTGIEIESVGFCMSFDNDYIGLSPDGFTKDRTGAIEIKCPSTKTHCKYIRVDKVPTDYKGQILMYFIINEKLEYLDFVSFDDRFLPKPIWIKRVTRLELIDEINEAKFELDKFLTKFLQYYKKVNS